MTNQSLARFVCGDDTDAAGAFTRYLDRVRDEQHARGQSSYHQDTGSRITVEYFTTPPRLERIA